MTEDLRSLFQHRDLLWMWTLREIRVRYKQSLLGAAWAVLQPLSLTVIFTIVFSIFIRVPSDGSPYPVFAYTGLAPWTLFSTAITFAVPSLITNMQLVTKIYFPREILPLACIGAAVVDFVVALLILFAMMGLYRLPVTPAVLWLPVLLAIQILLMTGISLLAAGTVVHYRDVRFVLPLVLQLWMYASPVVYSITLVPARWRLLYALNPMAGMITGYRDILLAGRAPALLDLATAGAVSLCLCVAGYVLFKRIEPGFADII